MSKSVMKLFRVSKIKTQDLWASAGFDLNPEISLDKVKQELSKRYAPFAPRIAIFWQESIMTSTIVGIEVMAFTVDSSDNIPRAGLVSCDPINSEEIHRVDGALRSELERMNIWSDTDKYEWRSWYQTGGK